MQRRISESEDGRGGPSRILVKNSIFLYVLTFSNYFVGLLLFPYISRVLSVEGFGLISFSMMYVLVFQVLVEFGFMISTTALIAKHRDDTHRVSKIVSSVMTAKALLVVVAAALFLFSAFFVPMLRDNLLIVSLFFASSVISAMLPDFYFRGIEKMKTITIRTVAVKVLTLLIIAVLVRDESQIIWIPVAFMIGNAIALTVAIVELRKHGVYLRVASLKRALGDIQQAFMFFLSRLAVSLNQSAGAFALGLKYSPVSLEVGIFSGATRVSMAGDLLLNPVSDSLYPHMVNKKDYRLFRKVIIFGGIVWLLGCMIVFIFAELICSVILGKDYAASGDLLRILLVGNFMAFFSNMFGYNALTPIGKALHANIALAVSAALNVVAYSVLWLTDSISLVSVCTVMAMTNFVVFGYRAVVLWRNRDLVQKAQRT